METRRRERRGPDWIGAELGLSPRTVSRVIARHGLPTVDPPRSVDRRGDPGQPGHHGPLRTGPTRGPGAHGRQEAGPDPRRRRLEGLGRDQVDRDRDTALGYDYVHSLIDDHSRFAYCEVLPDETGPTCAAFLDRAIDYFAAHGITAIEQLITDNAWAYRWSLRQICATQSIGQLFIKPHCPWQNGKAERLNRTLLTEWAYRQVFTSNDDRTAALAPWLEPTPQPRDHLLAESPPTRPTTTAPTARSTPPTTSPTPTTTAVASSPATSSWARRARSSTRPSPTTSTATSPASPRTSTSSARRSRRTRGTSAPASTTSTATSLLRWTSTTTSPWPATTC